MFLKFNGALIACETKKHQKCCCVRVLRPTNSLGHTETGPRFKVSYERLEKPVIEHTIPGLQGE